MSRSKSFIVLLLCIIINTSFALGETIPFVGSNDKLEIKESFGDVLSSISKTQMSLLESSSISTQEGSTPTNYYLRFGEASTSLTAPQVQHVKSDDNVIGAFIFIDRGTSSTDAFFEYEVEFEQGLKSKTTDNKLEDYDEKKIKLFGDEYSVIDSSIDTNSKEVEITLASSSVSDNVNEGAKKIYTLGGKMYEVELILIEEATKKVKIKINGQEVEDLTKGEFFEFQPDLFVGVTEVLVTSGASPDIARIFIGAKIVTLRDNDYSDSSFHKGVSVNKESLNNAFAQIVGSVASDVFSMSHLKYRLASTTKLYVPAGKRLSEVLDNPGRLLGSWDIKFEGMFNVQESPITFDVVGQTEYVLKFDNIDGQSYDVPFVSNVGGTFKFGDADQDLVVVEGRNTTDFIIDKDDYFVLSTGSAKTDHSYVLKYEDVDTNTKTIFFNDLASGSRSIVYSDSTVSGALGEATLVIGSANAKVYVGNKTDNPIVIDQNTDSSFNSGATDIITKGGAIIDLGATNSISSPYTLSLTTHSSSFEEGTSNEVTTFQIKGGSGDFKIDPDSFTGITLISESDQRVGMTDYGAQFTVTNVNAATPEELTIAYPVEQRFAEVYIEMLQTSEQSSSIQTITSTTCTNGLLDGDETGIDCGGSCAACPETTSSTCTNGVQDDGESGIDCGGSCVPCPQELLDDDLAARCPVGCVHVGENEKITCLDIGETIGQLYCSAERSLQILKENREVCTFNYECMTETCEEGKCGKKVNIMMVILNIILALLLLSIVYYATSLIQE